MSIHSFFAQLQLVFVNFCLFITLNLRHCSDEGLKWENKIHWFSGFSVIKYNFLFIHKIVIFSQGVYIFHNKLNFSSEITFSVVVYFRILLFKFIFLPTQTTLNYYSPNDPRSYWTLKRWLASLSNATHKINTQNSLILNKQTKNIFLFILYTFLLFLAERIRLKKLIQKLFHNWTVSARSAEFDLFLNFRSAHTDCISQTKCKIHFYSKWVENLMKHKQKYFAPMWCDRYHPAGFAGEDIFNNDRLGTLNI